MRTSLYRLNDTATISSRFTVYYLELKHGAQIQILHQGAPRYDEKQSFRLHNMQQPIDHRILQPLYNVNMHQKQDVYLQKNIIHKLKNVGMNW